MQRVACDFVEKDVVAEKDLVTDSSRHRLAGIGAVFVSGSFSMWNSRWPERKWTLFIHRRVLPFFKEFAASGIQRRAASRMDDTIEVVNGEVVNGEVVNGEVVNGEQ